MSFTTDICVLDLALAVLFDIRFQLVFGFIYAAYLVWRQPMPRKGAGNKAVFITGCDSGMGHRMARRLDEMKMHVFAGCLNPDGPGARSLKESCSKRLHVVPLDITHEAMVEGAAAYVKLNLPLGEKGLYCLINNAGVLPYTNFELMTVDLCKQVIDINLLGTIRVTKHFIPLLKKVPGRIVTITSIMARLTYPNTALYAATKHALNGFFSSLRLDLASSGIQIATIEPGDFSTTTNIMQWTKAHLEDMWTSLSPEEQQSKVHLYEETKRRVNKDQLPEGKQEENYRYLINDVEDAMFAEEPHTRYVSAPLSHRVALGVFRSLPERWCQALMVRSMAKNKAAAS